jgi:YVTN family beta-propeller protein
VTAAATTTALVVAGAGPAFADAPLSVIATVPVGSNPYAVALSPDGTRAYVADQGSTTVSVVDTATDTVSATIGVAGQPTDVAVSPDGKRAYVTNQSRDIVSVIDTTTETLTASISTAYWGTGVYGVAVSPDGATVYATVAGDLNSSVGYVVVIDTATNTITNGIAVGRGPYSVAVSPDGSQIYTANSRSNTVDVINTATQKVTSAIPGLSTPESVAISPDGKKAYIANTGNGTVGVIDAATDTVTDTVPIGDASTEPVSVAVSPDGAHVYVADIAGSVDEIDTATDTVGTGLGVSGNPVSVAVSPGGNLVYVALNGGNALDVLTAPPPTVTAVSPAQGPSSGGKQVTITGTNLSGATGITFGPGNPATNVSCTATSCTATAPAEPAGTVDIQVTTASGTSTASSADQYTYVAAPVVTAVSPNTGLSVGGTVVTVTGTGLAGASITFGPGNPATNVSCTATNCTATAPAEPVGTVDVQAMTVGGTSAAGSADQYTYIPPAPVITSISPATGPRAGGTAVTITGTDFDGTTAVSFGATPATSFTVVSPTQITAVSPAASDVGAVDVTVTTAAGTSTTGAADQYTYTFPACSVNKTNFRWHYATATATGGGWSGTKTATCPGTLTMGPQAMDGALHIAPGTTLKAGYDFTVPGNRATQTLSAAHPQVVFTVACTDHSTPTQPTITITMPSGHYTFTGSAWIPSGEQNSTLTYQGSITVPDLCGGANLDLSAGGIFSTTLN